MSISEYFIPFTRIGISLHLEGERGLFGKRDNQSYTITVFSGLYNDFFPLIWLVLRLRRNYFGSIFRFKLTEYTIAIFVHFILIPVRDYFIARSYIQVWYIWQVSINKCPFFINATVLCWAIKVSVERNGQMWLMTHDIVNRHMILTALGVLITFPYKWVALLKSAKTRRPPEPRSHQGPGFSAACTAGNKMCLTLWWNKPPNIYYMWNDISQSSRRPTEICKYTNPILTWMMLCIWGIRRSIRTSSNMTRARHTFFRTSESSSVARAKRL